MKSIWPELSTWVCRKWGVPCRCGIAAVLILLQMTFLNVSVLAQPAPLLIPSERETFINNKFAANDDTWLYLKSEADSYLSLSNSAYGIYEKAASLALAYRVSGNTAYRDKAMDMFMAYFINGTFNYQGRNDMRWAGPWAFLTYTWLYNEWAPADKSAIIDRFNTWAQYWISHSAPGASPHFRIGDSDHITFLAEIYLMMAISLENEAATTLIENSATPLTEAVIVASGGTSVATSDILFAKSDWVLADMVVAQYMNVWMKGGLWSEGSDYSPGTMEHWMRAYLINKEVRNIAFPNTYHEEVLYTTVHSIFPAFNGTFQYRDIEQVAAFGDYRPPSGDYRYNMMLHLLAMQSDSNVKALGQYWLNTVKTKEANAATSASEVWRFLFEEANATAQSPQNLGLDTTFMAEGEGFVATRSSWAEDASVLYFLNSKSYVDHEHSDALSFDIVHKGAVITKEMTGYRLNATDSPPFISTAHNTLLIENESPDGSSNPRGRAEGDGVNRVVASTAEYTYIEADATKVYNRGEGYLPDIYADNVVRKIAFLKNLNLVVVYDNIVILPAASPRWTKYIQHFQQEPVLINGVYSATRDGSRFFFKSLYPANVAITKVDESVLWAGETVVEAPLNQRKWHLSLTNPANPDDAEYLNVLYFDDDTVPTMPTSTLLHSDAANVISNNVTGTHIIGTNSDTLVLFNNNPDGIAIQSTISYRFGSSNNSTHYIYGIDTTTGYSVNSVENGGETTVTATPGGSLMPSSDGVLSFNITANQVSDLVAPVITLTGANPQTITVNTSYNELGASATDNVDGEISASILIDASAVDTLTVGSYSATYNVADTAGNNAIEVIRTVNVIAANASDTSPPVISLLGDNPLTITLGGSYSESGATATDDVDGDISGNIVINSSAVDTTTVGSYSVTYNVSDTAGNNATLVSRSVNVVAPVTSESSSTANSSGGGALAGILLFLLAARLVTLLGDTRPVRLRMKQRT